MNSLRSWYFVISFLLVRCRCESATLESKGIPSVPEREGDSPLAPMGRDLNAAAPLFVRETHHANPMLAGVLVGGILGGLIVAGLALLVYMNFRRRQILDVEKRVVNIDGCTSPSDSKPGWISRLRSLRRKRLSPTTRSVASEKSFGNAVGEEAVQPYIKGLPYEIEIPTLPKPAAVLNQSLPLAAQKTNKPFIVALPVDGAPQRSVVGYDNNNRSSRRKVQIPPGSPLAQSMTAPKRPPRPRLPDFILGNPTRSSSRHSPRKRSLLSGPPLNQQLPTSPTESDILDVVAHNPREESITRSEEHRRREGMAL